MRRPRAAWLLLVIAVGLLPFASAWRRAPTEVDLALVLAVDVSTSMDPDEQQLQRQGYVEAFRSPLVHLAIRTGVHARIAVAYVEWAGTHEARSQSLVVPLTILESPGDAIAFADRLARTPMARSAGTSLSGAIDFGVALLWSGHILPARRVIDISGDGSNNQGRLVTEARDEAIARGITINGLPILLKDPDRREDATLDAYYRDCVIGGPGAFMIPVRERRQFLTETRAKIVREIAGAAASGSPVEPVRDRSRTDCDTSESLWDDLAPTPHAPATGTGREL
jgi:hypothetical protein